MTELPAEARERIAREFAPGDRDAAELRVAAYQAKPFAPGGIWADLLELARGSLRWLDDALALGGIDWRDLMVAADVRRVERQLLAPNRHGPLEAKVLGPAEIERIRRDFVRTRALAAEYFPAEQLGEVMEIMGASGHAANRELFPLARGDAGRLSALLDGRPAGETDPDVPAPLAALPLIAAVLIRRDFAPEHWQAAARAASAASAHAYDWLLVMEYAGGDPEELVRALRLVTEDYRALSAGVARRRDERRTAQEG